MPIEIVPLTPHIGARLSGIDVRRPLTVAEVEAIDAGMNRHAVLVLPGQDISDEQQLAFTRNFGPLEEGANSTVTQFRAAPRPRLRRRLQPRQVGREARARQQAAHGGAGQPAVALRRLVPRRAGQVLDPERPHRHDRGRQHRVRRHARGLRRARCRDQGRDRGSGLRALADLFARPARLHRVPARRARGDEAGAPSAGAHPSRLGPQVAVPVGAYRHHRRLAAARGDGLHPRPDRARHPARSSSIRTAGRSTTW